MSRAVILVFLFVGTARAQEKSHEVLPAVGETPQEKGPIVYQGIPVSDAWISSKFRRFKDKVLYVDGKLVPLSRVDIRKKSGEILAVLTDGSCLLEEPDAGSSGSRKGRKKEIPAIHLSGLPAKDAVPGRSVSNLYVIKNGTYTFTTGADERTVDSYQLVSALTRKEFESALRSGQKLPRITAKDRKLARELALEAGGFEADRESEIPLIEPAERKPAADSSARETSRLRPSRRRRPTFLLRGRASTLANGERTKRTRLVSVLVGEVVREKPHSGKACYRFRYANGQKARSLVLLIKDYDLSAAKGVRLYVRTDAPQNGIRIMFQQNPYETSPDILLAGYTAEGSISGEWTRVDIPRSAITRTDWKADRTSLIVIGYPRGVRKSPCTIWVDDIEAILP